jgi:hypothetical protein
MANRRGFLAGLALALALLGCRERAVLERDARLPAEERGEGYAGSGACGACHEREHATWDASYHSRMTQAASPAAIRAPFRGTTPVDEGLAWLLEQSGERFFATPLGPDGIEAAPALEVVLTTGSHHYQIYWLATAEGGLVALPFTWDLREEAWIPRRSQFLVPPGRANALEVDRWQRVCIKCHTTRGIPEAPPDAAPRVREFGIACEACHGPGARHAQAMAERAAKSAPATDEEPELHIVQPAELDHRRSAMVCGQCHAIHPFRSPAERAAWRSAGFEYRPGDDLALTRELLRGRPEQNPPELLRALEHEPEVFAELFWPDGEVRVSGREYNGLVESPCYQRGELDCLSCHRMHRGARDERDLADWADDQLERGMDASAACTQCHAEYATPARAAEHSRHPAGSTGADCLNCHMPLTTYGLTKSMRSHTITSPSAAAALETGRPLACNLCHLDQSLGWAADRLGDWYGHERPRLSPEEEELSAIVLLTLRGDAGARALCAFALGWEPARAASGSGWMGLVLTTLLADPYDAVARVALRTARLDPRYRDLTMDFTLRDARRMEPVLATLQADWLREGLAARPEQRAALLLLPDGTLDEARMRALLAQRDGREMELAE